MLNFIATPIGNLNDISQRAIDAIRNCDYLYAEDTRVTKNLLNLYQIKKACKSFHEHNEKKLTSSIVKHLLNNKNISIVSDAGTPGISDPGYNLIRECVDRNIKYTLIPGPSSVINGLIMSGLPTDKFCFYGFFPRKQNKIKESIELLKREDKTSIFFESTKRMLKTLKYLEESLQSERKISICMEMTKIHERVIRSNISNIISVIHKHKISMKGEAVLVIDGISVDKCKFTISPRVKDEFLEKLSAADAAKLISLITNENKRDIYKSLIEN